MLVPPQPRKKSVCMSSVFDPQHQANSIDSRLVATLERISEVFRIQLWQQYKQHNLTPLQIQILIHLLFDKPEYRTVTHLARELSVTKATISDAVRVLEQKQLISKAASVEDARRTYLILTNRGEMVAQQVSLFANAVVTQVSGLEHEQKAMILEGLLQMIERLQNANMIPCARMCLSCHYFEPKPSEHGDNHYCNLVKQPLQAADLRFHCPEWTQKSA